MIENSHGPQAAAAVEAYLYEVTDGNARQGLMGTAHGHQGGHHGVKKGYCKFSTISSHNSLHHKIPS